MTTDTQPRAPTDAELAALIDKEMREYSVGAYADHGSAKNQLEHFARAVLAKWGTLPAVAGEQVDRADAVNLARNTLTQHDSVITKKGVRVLAEAVLSMDAAINAARKQGVNHD